MSLPARPHLRSEIETTPLVGMVVALLLAGALLAPKIAGWVLLAFVASCAARLFMNRPSGRLPSLPVKVLLFALGVGGVGLTYGSMLGIDPGLGILVVLVALKLIEANGARDFHVLALLGFFLALCGLFFSQDLIIWLYVAVIVTLLTATLVRFHRGPGPSSYRRSTVLALTLLGQALPVVVLLFLFFPRVYGGFRFKFSQSLLGSGGMSDRLSPGSVAALALSDEIVFRADFPDGNVPSMSSMYWRGGVLWHGDGLTWNSGPSLSRERRFGQLGGPGVRQRISLLPHGARWLFALDRPASNVRSASYQSGGYLQSVRAITSQFRYEVVSRPENREVTLPADQRVETLRLPANVSPRVRALVDRWKKEHSDPEELVENALQYFRRERFSYTLKPGTYQDATALDTFLFERREGFCEHYAAAFATLMRLAGIPSRLVIGYHGGEFNALGKYVIVRQADAHAWCEVWFKERGWQRIDPTDMIAPERISSGLASFLESRAARDDPDASQSSMTAAGWRELLRDVRLLWDSINYQWDLRVLNFDEDSQRSFLLSLGLGAATWPEILVWVAVVIGLILALLALWMRRAGHSGVDEVGRAYAHFCRMLERAGLRRESWEGPQHFGERAAMHFAEQAEAIRHVTALYIQLRYAPAAPEPRAFVQAVRRLPRLTERCGNDTPERV
jgi:transglutaminase-like putative cysteine protease